MSLPIDTHIPSYVHDLVVDAGRDNVYWATARDPGDRPGAGQTMDEWRDRVVGSGISASQSTASNQPIWRGDRLEFAGDDVLIGGLVDSDPSHISVAAVARYGGSGSTGAIWTQGQSSGGGIDHFLTVEFVDSTAVQSRHKNSAGDTANAKISSGVSTGSIGVAIAEFDIGSASTNLRWNGVTDSNSTSSTGGMPSSGAAIGDFFALAPVNPLVGDIYELLVVNQPFDDRPALESRLQTKWGI